MSYPGYELSSLDRLHRADEIRRQWHHSDHAGRTAPRTSPRPSLTQRVRRLVQRTA